MGGPCAAPVTAWTILAVGPGLETTPRGGTHTLRSSLASTNPACRHGRANGSAGRPTRSDAGRQDLQSTATPSAPQICSIRTSPRRPIRSTRTPSATLSTVSSLTAQRRGTGSSPGSSTTSLGRPRTIVVHGAISARWSRGMATSRDRTTTGRRPTSGSSHHHTSARAGGEVTRPLQQTGTTPGHPSRRLRPGVVVVGGVGGVDLRRALSGEERGQRVVDQRGIRRARLRRPGLLEQVLVHSRADPQPGHTTTTPLIGHPGDGSTRGDHRSSG